MFLFFLGLVWFEVCVPPYSRVFWPRLDLEYPIYGDHELADEGAFTSVVVLTASFPSGFRRGRDLNLQPPVQEKLLSRG